MYNRFMPPLSPFDFLQKTKSEEELPDKLLFYSPHKKAVEAIEPDLRTLLPAELYANLYVAKWADAGVDKEKLLEQFRSFEKEQREELIEQIKQKNREDGEKLLPVFNHLAALQKILSDYTSSLITEKRVDSPRSLLLRRNGALMFTDLAGFTKLMEAYAGKGKGGAEDLLKHLTSYFTSIIEVISKAGGELLEFTGDALFVLFPIPSRHGDEEKNRNELRKAVIRAVRAGVRMQEAMESFKKIETDRGPLTLQMRIGIHAGGFYSTDVGTPRRKEHVLLGRNVQLAKKTESNGENGRVNLSLEAHHYVSGEKEFAFKEGKPGYMLLEHSDKDTSGFDITAKTTTRRLASAILEEKNFNGAMNRIQDLLDAIKQFASFIPSPVLNLIVESAAQRRIPADFPSPTVMFVNFIGLPEMIDKGIYDEESIVESFNDTFARINAAVEKRGGVLKKITYHLTGSDIVIYFGVPTAHTNDPMRAASAALEIREIIRDAKVPRLMEGISEPETEADGKPKIYSQIGINLGPTFVAEIGHPRGRREFNVLGDTVNTTARLMSYAGVNEILVSDAVKMEIEEKYDCESIGEVSLKGKGAPMALYKLGRSK